MQHDELVITPKRRLEIEQELTEIRTVKRPEILEAISKAREYGDLSENFEYQAARQAQAILNGRVEELEHILDRAVVRENATASDSVGMGAVVTVRDLEAEDEWEYTIVDAISADPANDRISLTSPVGKALMGKRMGDKVDVAIPAGIAHYEIIGLKYE